MGAHADGYVHNLAKAALRDMHLNVQLKEEWQAREGPWPHRLPRYVTAVPSCLTALLPSLRPHRLPRRLPAFLPAFPPLPSRPPHRLPAGLQGTLETAKTLENGDANDENHWDKFLETPVAQAAIRNEMEAHGVVPLDYH